MTGHGSVALLGGLGVMLLAACTSTSPQPRAPVQPLDTALTIASPNGCRLDDDCAAGTFCFQQRCVTECTTDAQCPAQARCSPRGRCVTGEAPDSGVDETAFGTASTDVGGLTLTGWPTDSVLRVTPTAPFVSLRLTSSGPVTEGRLLYSVQLSGGALSVARAEGSTTFELAIPTGTAGSDTPAPQVVEVVTPIERRTLYLVPARPRAGWYTGTFVPPVFGGPGLPLEFAIQTEPADVLSLSDATAAWAWLPTAPEFLVSLATVTNDRAWVRRPLTYDASIGTWVALFAEDIAPAKYFGPGVFPLAGRSLRLEISQEDDGTLTGALADRWRGLFDQRNADGLRSPGVAMISGRFSVSRLQALPPTSQVRDGLFTPSMPQQQPAPELTMCGDAFFAVPAAAGQTDGPCKDVGNVATFRTVDAAKRATCALGVAREALAGPTVGMLLNALLDPSVPDPIGVTFKTFIEDCASDTSPTCKPTPKLSCARALVATAYLDADAASADVQRLSEAYDATTKEAFLGRQLAAFQVDTQTRLAWLQSSEAPPFLASTLRDYNMQILDRWRGKVLDAHLDSVFGQLDAAGLAVLTRSPTDPVAISNRQALLLDLSNSWRASMDALSLLTTRWNVLLQDSSSRARAAASVRATAAKLYAIAAILQELARESGASYLSSNFGAGFSMLLRELNRLSVPFDVLLFARDAEVVTSRSLDPNMNSRSLLRERELAARNAVKDATASVDLVLAEAQQTAVDGATLTARYEDQLLTLRNELISLCGLPVGCTAAEVGNTPECAVPTAAGRCGFAVNRDGTVLVTESVSEAGSTLLTLKEAAASAQEADARLAALVQQANLVGSTTEAFAQKVIRWDGQRRAVSTEIEALLADIATLNEERIDAAVADVRIQQTRRVAAYARQEANIANWDQIRARGIASDLKKLQTINGLNIASSALELAADRTDLLAKIMKEALPKQVGATTDPSFIARMGVRFPAWIASSALLVTSNIMEANASSLSVVLEGEQALREAELTNLEQLPDLDAMATENELSELQKEIDLSNLKTEKQVNSLRALVEALRRNLELDLAYDRDLQQLSDRRDTWRSLLVDSLRLEYGVLQAQLTARQREIAYYEVVQRAQLLEGRYLSLSARFGNLESLLGSPDVLFSFANRMARAESRIDRSRRALEEWLVALEYYAVRPFVDQRLAILLARNPAQLEAIANEFLRLQRACGGPVTIETVDVSLRDDLLGMDFATAREGSAPVSAGERFRALMQRALRPVNRKVPLSATQTLGQRLDRGEVLAGTFGLSVEGFANLARSCNAKVESVAVQVVGEGFTGQPVVSIVYDGSSQLRSCQPGLDTLVQSLGPGTTAFASVTPFKTAGRAVSPIASVGGFGPAQTWNATLEGLPLAAGYTVLIDLTHPSNAALPWDRLEDVRLQFRYSYQDVFPEGQCQ
jgi:hypothetical protein